MRIIAAMKQYDGVPLDGRAMKIEMAAGVAQVQCATFSGTSTITNRRNLNSPNRLLEVYRPESLQGHGPGDLLCGVHVDC